MQNTNFNQTNTQSLFNTLNPSSFSQKQNMTQSLNSLGSTDFSAAKQKSFRSVADLEGEPELSQKNSISDWSDVPNVNSDSDPNIKLSSAYFGVNGNFDGYFEDFTTQEPIDFNKLKESSDSKYEDQSSSSSSSLSKTSKKITKLQKEDLLKHNTPKKSERNSKGKKNPWQPSEDARVLELVAHYGHSWALVAAALGNRTGKQVRDRYLNYLRSDIKDEDFTVEEDRLLLSWYYQLGHKWSKIASHIPGRTECQVKNRFYAHIKKRLTFPDFPENKANYQKNMADIFFEDEVIVNNNENENVFIYEEKKEVEFREIVNDPTDVISYENKNKNFAQMSQSIQFSAPAFPRTLSTISIPENNMVKQNDISNNFLSSFNNISSFCEETLYKPESQTGLSLENDFEISHKQALLGLESEVNNREKMQRYEELVKRKKALEFFYNKTLKEMNDLELGDLSYNKSA